MAIVHPTVKAPGNKLFAAADWNAGHTIQPDTLLPNVISPDDKHHYFGTGKDVDVYFQSATSFFRIVNGSNYFLLPRLTSPEIKSVMNINMILGDNAGVRYYGILNSTPAFVFKCDSVGRILLSHQFTLPQQFSAPNVTATAGVQHDYSTNVLAPAIIPVHKENISGPGSTTWYIEMDNSRIGNLPIVTNCFFNYLINVGAFTWRLELINMITGAVTILNAGGPVGGGILLDLMAGAGPFPPMMNQKLAVTITLAMPTDNVDVFGLETHWFT